METWDTHLQAMGAYIREQRRTADLSLRELASRTSLSNAYLSQLERGLNEPSLTVVRAIARALNIPVSTLLSRMGLDEEPWAAEAVSTATTKEAIRNDASLTAEQKEALLAVYRSYLAGNGEKAPREA